MPAILSSWLTDPRGRRRLVFLDHGVERRSQYHGRRGQRTARKVFIPLARVAAFGRWLTHAHSHVRRRQVSVEHRGRAARVADGFEQAGAQAVVLAIDPQALGGRVERSTAAGATKA
jgi:hypothetical protein